METPPFESTPSEHDICVPARLELTMLLAPLGLALFLGNIISLAASLVDFSGTSD